ncbi:Cytochrome c homolog [Rhodovastum atsumiense]|uniref:Cytochrome c family protein n=1 Tax=Rhodovastum atsumiense TaxID=504468 RepID=A0A5M6IVQ5_9PROT|nr:cytochrome c family protein [Rhodovastum atsumiense]KAA5612400.1 cytochrome c family protein [Rhodovastum atsumiense]CAH2600306.1 Cytochrome c homolog [Rhodovastum atsumiense]
MDTLEINKAVAAVLIGGISFMVAGLIGDVLVRPKRLEKVAIPIETGAPVAATAAPAAETVPPIGPLLAKADPAKGEATVKKLCVACHTFNEGGKPGVGPNLYGVVMGPHGHQQGFSYSAGLKDKPGNWDYEALNHWLKKPAAYAPGTKMAFAGISNDQDRANVIAYLRSLSASPAPLPQP